MNWMPVVLYISSLGIRSKALTVQEGEVYPPGVDPDALNPPAIPGRFGDPILDLPSDSQHVPVQTIRQPDGHVRKAVHLLEGYLFAVETPHHSASALRSQIHGQECGVHSHHYPIRGGSAKPSRRLCSEALSRK